MASRVKNIGWRWDPTNTRGEIVCQETVIARINTGSGLNVIGGFLVNGSAVGSPGDDTLFNLGTSSDIAQVLRSTALDANTTLAGVVEGTAATLATAANSLIISNITDDGDIHLIVSKAGNSHTAFLADGSTGDTILNAATGQSVDHYVAGTKEYDFSATAVDLNGNHLDNAGYLIMNAVTLPAASEVYIGHDNTGDATVNALTGKAVHLAVNGTDVLDVAGAAITLRQAVTVSTGGLTITAGGLTVSASGITVTGDSTITGGLTVTGSLTFGGNWTVGATLTVDELVLDTDGVAPAGTVNYLVNDNTGDTTANVLTGKQFIVAVNGSDEYTFSSTILDMLANALDNCGYIILNAATAPAATEVYLVNDNTGDLTLNALTTKSINLAVANIDIVALNYTLGSTSGSLIINETGEDINYRYETDGLAYAIYGDGGKNCIVLGDNTDISSADNMVVVGNVAKTASNNASTAIFKVVATASFTGQGTNAVMASAWFDEPNLTAGGATITDAATVYISGEPTEGGTGNYALMSVGSIGIIADAKDLVLGAGRDVLMRWSTADADNHAFAIGLGASNAMHIAQGADIATDWNVAADTNPTWRLHSATTPATDFIAMYHTGTVAAFNGVGATTLQFLVASNAELEVTATVVYINGNTLAGSQASGGDMTLQSTSHATKGCITIANAEEGIKIGAVTNRATTEPTNALSLFNGTAPVGTLANGVTLYSTGGELYVMDAGGTATPLS